MTRGRWAIAVFLLVFVAPPILLPTAGLIGTYGWSAWRDTERLVILATASLGLALGTTLVVLPTGTLLAVVLFKSDLPGRVFLRRLVVLGLFVPLPLLATAWQSALGGGLAIFTADPGRPWPSGFPA